MPFTINRNNLLYEMVHNYSYIWHVITQFGKISFVNLCITKLRRSFVCQLCVLVHAQKKRPISLKFRKKILERVFEKSYKRLFFLIDLDSLE